MKSNAVLMQKQLQEKQKIIEYLKTQFQAETGKQVSIPVSLTNVLGIPAPLSDGSQEDIYSIEKEELRETFLEAVHKLKLP